MHIFHDWSKWETIEAIYTLGPLFGRKAGQQGLTIAQKRTCKKCGLEEIR